MKLQKGVVSFALVFFILLQCFLPIPLSFTKPIQPTNTYAAQTVNRLWSLKMADSVINRGSSFSWNYESGIVLKSILDLWLNTDDKKYYEFVKSKYDSLIASDGSINSYKMSEYNLDQINAGKPLFTLYNTTSDKKYKTAISTLRQQIEKQPRTSQGGFWHKQKYPNQMWLDGIYMASPFYAEYAKVFGEAESFDDVTDQILLIASHTKDSNTGLYFHGWDESKSTSWSNSQTGTSPIIWGRSIGWYTMAIVDVLDFLPQDNPKRQEILSIFQELINAVANVQDQSTGLWYQVLDKGSKSDNWLEASASCMFVYSMSKGIRKGYIDTKYLENARKGHAGIVNEFITTDSQGRVSLTSTCSGTSIGANYDYYIERGTVTNDYKGIGPFILASIELENIYGLGVDITPTPTTLPTIAPTSHPTQEIVYGDVSGNGIVDSGDYLLMRKYILNIISTMPEPNWMVTGDVNDDNVIDSGDYLLMRRFLLRIINIFPAAS